MHKFRSLPLATRLFLLALVLRLAPVLFSIGLPIGLTDMFQYDMLARSLLAGNGFRWYAQEDVDLIRSSISPDLFPDFIVDDYDPRGVLTSFRAPAYPAFLAGVYAASGLEWRWFAARLAQAAIGATLAPLGYLLARRLFRKQEEPARFAGYALAFYPLLILYPLALATENLFIPLVAAGTLALLRAADNSRGRHYLLAGALLGLATLTRSVIFLFVGLAGLWIWFAVGQRRGAIIFVLTVLALVVPWSIRNTLLHGRPTFVENSMGYNLHMGYHPEGDGTFQFGISLELVPYLDDGLRNDLGVQAAIGFIRQDPGRVPELVLNKLGYFFALERRALSFFYTNNFFGPIPTIPLVGLFLLFTLPFPLLATLAALAVPFVRVTKERLLVYLLIGGYLLPHLFLIAEDRFHVTLLPVLAAFAGVAWHSRAQFWAQARANRRQLALALLLVGLLWLNWGAELWRDADNLALLFGPDGNLAGFSY
ncbi:MAG TPA: glycosyltransferase family 39 protein [Anaerolineales bacterium]|nr:glycosyltransferase family 39 protein [Anaerolineales bacterium]